MQGSTNTIQFEEDIIQLTTDLITTEEEYPSLLAIKIVNSLKILGSKALDMRNIPGEMKTVTESVRWLERRKYVDIFQGTKVTKGKAFSYWSYKVN
ncbi:hypothetical protein [Desulfovibrio litoralis]|uniref:Uncharacterized protein n=1 Tax=Desulfovibrio litoralis DSM 11393 TaxID=1121455 RepID=A0A1M7SRK4_9BACT|nr:hypothetical protein [Desulfovibrio litoralis]SHN61135.1 hypothetical protein SAMN02745728_01193 [Desulfovibrio litoralis DSM 11393]